MKGKAWLALAAALLAGCATPAARIKRNPDAFAQFPPEVQEKVRQGRIELGFTRPMVYIALGDPQRIYDRVSAGRTNEVWAYTGEQGRPEPRPVATTYWYRCADGRLRLMQDWVWMDAWRGVEIDLLRVEFEGDIVRAIESLRP